MNRKAQAAAPEQDMTLLLEGVRADAEARIQAVEAQAAEYASAKLAKASEQAAAIAAEASAAASAREASIRAVYEARLRTETRKLELESEEGFMRHVLDLAAADYANAARAPGYGDRVFAWVCEAAIGIGSDEVEMRFSDAEAPYLDDEFLARVEQRAAELAARPIRLRLSKAPRLESQGILLEAEGGRLRYDNTAPARLARAESAMRAVIRKALEPAMSDVRGTPDSRESPDSRSHGAEQT
jgi:vacuolar-type H+-ATPase subunit E/Vma4